jgi:hypothetical protein
MLQRQAVEPHLLLIIERLFTLPWAKDFLLVGGTNVALQLGHRLSVDIDLFTNNSFVPRELLREIERDFLLQKNEVVIRENGLMAFFQPSGVKVDIFHVDLDMKLPPVNWNDIKLANLMDVAAMKIEAMVQRRVKKDYIDLYFIFQQLDPQQCLAHFHKVDQYCSPKSVAFALTEVDTAASNSSEMPKMLLPVSWEDITTQFRKVATQYSNTLGINIDLN